MVQLLGIAFKLLAIDCYTSRLDVRLSADLQGRTVNCSVDDGAVTLIGTMTLIVSTPSGI